MDIPLRRNFVASTSPRPEILSPMIRLYRESGRGGSTVIRLYIAILWRASQRPFEVSSTAGFWAALLDLKNPTTSGAVSIRRALKKLQEESLIEYKSDKGNGTIITPLREDGSGREYTLPSNSYKKAKTLSQRERHAYLRVPTELWKEGIFQSLNGSALVMLLILLNEYSPNAQSIWFSEKIFKERYGLSSRTKSDGIKELRERNLISEISVPLSYAGVAGGGNKDMRRRKVYYLNVDRHKLAKTPFSIFPK